MHYQGSCHCGRIAFTLTTDAPITEAMDCNCSLCRRRGGLLWFGPRQALVLDAPAEGLPAQGVAEYRFNHHHIAHHFCRDCGIAPYSEAVDPRSGALMAAVNLRCVPGLDLAALQINTFDGAAL
jgi:hypothetical protein